MTALLLASESPLNHVVQHTAVDLNPGAGFWSMPIISNHIIMQVAAALLLIWLFPKWVRQRAGDDEIGRLVPRGWGNALEALCSLLREQVFRPNLGAYTDTFSPFLWTTFFFLLCSNVLGLIPLSTWLWFVPHELIGGTSTGNIYVTSTLALITLFVVVGSGLRYHGMAYIRHFFMGPLYIAWLIGILEMAGMLFKTMALSLRLFANMLAGHVLLAVLLGFCGAAFVQLGTGGGVAITILVIVGSVLIYFLEILVAFLHAFIFTALAAVFIGMAVNIHHDEAHEHEHEHGEVPTGTPAVAHG